MSNISRSPERMTFQAASYERKLAKDPDNKAAKEMVEIWRKWREEAIAQELDEEWQRNNLEYELRTCEPILKKVRESDKYAQNLYAAMCNMQWCKLVSENSFDILKENFWSCSWRHSGGIIADMRMQGDYIDWYCSGIGSGLGNGDEDGTKGYVPESVVTEEIEMDLRELGWVPVPWDDES